VPPASKRRLAYGSARRPQGGQRALGAGASGSGRLSMPGAGGRSEAGSREPGAGSREPGAGSREPGAGRCRVASTSAALGLKHRVFDAVAVAGGAVRLLGSGGLGRRADPATAVEVIQVLVQHHLEAGGVALLGDDGRPREEEVPDAVPALAVGRDDRVLVADPVIVPALDRVGVVHADVVDAERLPARL